jgi:predicted acylesterase/phospholipase RssA
VLTVLVRGLVLGVLLTTVTGCASAPVNPRLAAYGPGGYRYANVRGDGADEELFVILAFSGGGTRAAAFSYGVLEGLHGVRYRPGTGAERTLLEDVDVISSVSGGSFTAAHYALFGTQGFKQFEDDFLHRNIQGRLVARALVPWNWPRLLRPDYSRIDLAADLYDELVFRGATFATLLQAPRGRPYVLLNATDMTFGARFEFTQDQFDLLCSDLSSVPVARAVAASSAFPILLSPLTLHNHGGDHCDRERFTAPPWLQTALEPRNPPRRQALAQQLISYRRDLGTRPYVHLLDGGLADNIGLRGPYVALSGQDSAWSVYTKINQRRIRRVLVITANARTGRDPGWDMRPSPPGISGVLGLVTTGPMGNYSFETVQLIAEHFGKLNADRESLDACDRLAKPQCPAFSLPFEPPAPVTFHAVELAFDKVTDDDRLKRCLEGFATSFTLPRAQVTLLRQVAQRLLMVSPEFREAMAAIAPGWRPRDIPIDPGLVREACPKD